MEVIVYYPETPEKQALSDQRVAKFHAQYVENRIKKLQCPTWQKLKLIDAIAETIMEKMYGARKKKKRRNRANRCFLYVVGVIFTVICVCEMFPFSRLCATPISSLSDIM